MFTGLLATIMFCVVGQAVDGKCPDGSPATQVELHVMTATDCSWSDTTASTGPKNCVLQNVIEITRDGKTVATIPASVLTEQEQKLMLQNFFGSR